MRRILTTGLVVLGVLLSTPGIGRSQEKAEEAKEAKDPKELAKEMDKATESKIQALPGGQIKVLKAVVMSVKGKSQWKGPEEKASWQQAKVDDALVPGTSIRTGRKSNLVIRVGMNATIVVDRNTRMVIPQIIQSGQTLKTAVKLTRGRADFKVDRVGLTNDFSVVTPSTTMAVRGTGYGVQYGGFRGTEVFVSPRDELSKLELQYFLTRFSHFLDGGTKSSDSEQNPAISALFDTFGPPVISNRIIADPATLNLMADSYLKDPVLLDPLIRTTFVELRQIDLGNQGFEGVTGGPAGGGGQPPPDRGRPDVKNVAVDE